LGCVLDCHLPRSTERRLVIEHHPACDLSDLTVHSSAPGSAEAGQGGCKLDTHSVHGLCVGDGITGAVAVVVTGTVAKY
jgi:hypothetical protein